MNELLQAAKAMIDYEKDHSYNFADRVAALRAAVERVEKHEAVGFDEWWSANANSEIGEVAIHKWDECWIAAQQAERERIKAIINGVDVHSNWDSGVLSTLRRMQDTILEKIDER